MRGSFLFLPSNNGIGFDDFLRLFAAAENNAETTKTAAERTHPVQKGCGRNVPGRFL